VMYFRTPLATPRAQGGAGAWWAAVTCALLLIGIGVYPEPLMRVAERAANSGRSAVGSGQWAVVGSGNAPYDLYAFRNNNERKAAAPVCPVTWSGGNSGGFFDIKTSTAPPVLLLSRMGVTTGCHSDVK
jgi:hypothetical protein